MYLNVQDTHLDCDTNTESFVVVPTHDSVNLENSYAPTCISVNWNINLEFCNWSYIYIYKYTDNFVDPLHLFFSY